ncbi:MAG: hypothetical protein AAB540_04545 [Patescibacteria group bacterium]
MDENTFKIGGNPDATAPAPTANQPQTPPTTSATPPQAPTTPLASPAPQPTPPVINTKLNVQLDKSVDTQLSRLGEAKSKLLSSKSYLVIGILIIALAATAYGAYIFFFAEESATEENSEDLQLTNKLGSSEGAEDSEETSEEASSPPSLTINLSEDAPAAETGDTDTTGAPNTLVNETDSTADGSPATSKVPR